MSANPLRAQKVFFELTNACNFRCDFCPIDTSARARRHMDWTLFTKGIDEITEREITDTIGFHILGEPLLYPRIFEALAYSHRRGLRTEINTNGSLLTSHTVNSLCASGLSQLAISVQTVGEQAFAGRRASLSYRDYHARVMAAVRTICDSDSDTHAVLCFMDTSTRRFFDIDRRLCLGPGTDSLKQRLATFMQDVYGAIGRPVERFEVENALRALNLRMPTIVRLTDRVSVYVQPLADWGNAFTDRKVYPAKIGACGYALVNVGVLSNGEVTVCCADYDGKTSLGNLNTSTLADLLASDQAERIREGFRRCRIVHPHCQRCIGSPSHLKAAFKGLASIYLFRWRGFQPSRVKRVALLGA